MINVGDTEPFENEIRIPEKYRVKQAIGDTIGPGGIFRALRTILTMLDIANDVEEVCPDALFLNYTNPMSILCQTLYDATDVDTVGLCHSVPHTAGRSPTTSTFRRTNSTTGWPGINHVAWFLKAEHDGERLPSPPRSDGRPEIYERDTVRFEMMRHFGSFPTESSTTCPSTCRTSGPTRRPSGR